MSVVAKVSVIIPVYNAEPWIERCARSLFEQSMDEIEFIFVDDCSLDMGVDVMLRTLENYPYRKEQVRIIRHERNFGVSAARTSGMKVAKGEYIIHCDPDDWVDVKLYETMYNKAVEDNADIVVCDAILHYNGGGQKRKIVKRYKTPQDCIVGYCKKGGFYFSVCNKLVKRELIESYNIYPPIGINLGEDANMSIRMLYYANRISYINNAFYHYFMGNTQSITHRQSIRSNWEMGRRNTEDMVSFLRSKNPKKYRVTINFLRFCAKLKILRANSNDLRKFYDTYKDCRRDMLKFTCEPLKARIVYFLMCYSFSFLKYYSSKNN